MPNFFLKLRKGSVKMTAQEQRELHSIWTKGEALLQECYDILRTEGHSMSAEDHKAVLRNYEANNARDSFFRSQYEVKKNFVFLGKTYEEAHSEMIKFFQQCTNTKMNALNASARAARQRPGFVQGVSHIQAAIGAQIQAAVGAHIQAAVGAQIQAAVGSQNQPPEGLQLQTAVEEQVESIGVVQTQPLGAAQPAARTPASPHAEHKPTSPLQSPASPSSSNYEIHFHANNCSIHDIRISPNNGAFGGASDFKIARATMVESANIQTSYGSQQSRSNSSSETPNADTCPHDSEGMGKPSTYGADIIASEGLSDSLNHATGESSTFYALVASLERKNVSGDAIGSTTTLASFHTCKTYFSEEGESSSGWYAVEESSSWFNAFQTS